MPICTDFGRSLTKASAASCAAVMRVGLTSEARMLPETSIARMMVPFCEARVMTAAGRAMAMIRSVSATRSNAGGI